MKINKPALTFSNSEVNPVGKIIIQLTELGTGKIKLRKLYEDYLRENLPPENFWHDAIERLDLRVQAHYHSKNNIPENGRLVVIANHAFGIADGLTICSLISKIRQDYKIITHKVLQGADLIKNKIIPLDFSKNRNALINNIAARKECEEHLRNNGALIIFPSGSVSTKPKLKKGIKAIDREWKQFTSKIIMKTQSPVLPIFFEGQNSELFHVADKIGQVFRYSLMIYELKRRMGKKIDVHIGQRIPFETINEIGNLIEITKFLRDSTYRLDPSNKNSILN
jgi:putative hemolysin